MRRSTTAVVKNDSAVEKNADDVGLVASPKLAGTSSLFDGGPDRNINEMPAVDDFNPNDGAIGAGHALNT